MALKSQPLVSIIVPVYNAERFIEETIASVQAQTYENWELILVDDVSSDNSALLITQMQKDDKRIKLIFLEKNSGAAIARNKGLANADGRYISFLDADDIWLSAKLEKQVGFMQQGGYGFSFTSYEYANSDGVGTGKIATVPGSLGYREALKDTVIFTSTVMFDVDIHAKKSLMMSNVYSEDTALWWSILAGGYVAYGLNQKLVLYRRSFGTLSSNKLEAVYRTWLLYRKQQKLSWAYSFYCLSHYVVRATLRRI